ncbi:sulfotransferase domain-containing protein [Candidatus Pelagibacter sp.]|nr:sulfotransferase domain-containing protein [Candidatus Pelagibacter sp.]
MIIWLTSYPKSGNTWVRAFLAAYYHSKDGVFDFKLLEKIDQYPKAKYFDKKIDKPGEINQYWNSSQEKISIKKEIKIFKTHNSLLAINGNNFTSPKHTLGFIYIVRDPRNVLTSLKNHYDLEYEEAIDFMQNENKFIYDDRKKNQELDYANFQFLSSWSNHYKSWMNTNVFRKILIKYEDLILDPIKNFRNLVLYTNSLIKIDEKINEKKIQKCIETTNFELLKKKEENSGFPESVYSKKLKKNISFFNLGSRNQWNETVPKNLHKKINEIYKKDLEILGY